MKLRCLVRVGEADDRGLAGLAADFGVPHERLATLRVLIRCLDDVADDPESEGAWTVVERMVEAFRLLGAGRTMGAAAVPPRSMDIPLDETAPVVATPTRPILPFR